MQVGFRADLKRLFEALYRGSHEGSSEEGNGAGAGAEEELLEYLYDEDYVLDEPRCERLFVWLGVLKGKPEAAAAAAPEPEAVVVAIEHHEEVAEIVRDDVAEVAGGREGPITEEAWAGLELNDMRNRVVRIGEAMEDLAGSGGPRRSDFEVGRVIGRGANAIAYLARPAGRLATHGESDAILVLKVMLHMVDAAGDDPHALAHTKSAVDAGWEHTKNAEATGPGVDIPFRDNIVHILGSFDDSAAGLPEYPTEEWFNPNTFFVR